MAVRLSCLAPAAVLALLAVMPASAQTPDGAGRYLHDMLKEPAYRESWTRMVGRLGQREAWLKADRLSGPGGPSTSVTVAGQAFERVDTCKRHDCGDNRFYALFAPGGRRAVGVLIQPGHIRFFGHPTEEQQRALVGR